jgi:hypothetical protein
MEKKSREEDKDSNSKTKTAAPRRRCRGGRGPPLRDPAARERAAPGSLVQSARPHGTEGHGHADNCHVRLGRVSEQTPAAIPCVIYGAKSTEDKRGSIPDQLAQCRDAITGDARRGIRGEYTDEAVSAYRRDRGPACATRWSTARTSLPSTASPSLRPAFGSARSRRSLWRASLIAPGPSRV